MVCVEHRSRRSPFIQKGRNAPGALRTQQWLALCVAYCTTRKPPLSQARQAAANAEALGRRGDAAGGAEGNKRDTAQIEATRRTRTRRRV